MLYILFFEEAKMD